MKTQTNENSDKSHFLNNYIFYMVLPLFRLCKWSHITPSLPKKCVIYSNFQSFKLVVDLTWHNFSVFNIYCNHHVTRFSFLRLSILTRDQSVSQSEDFGGVAIKFTWFPPRAMKYSDESPPPPPISSWLAVILLWSSLDIQLAMTDPPSSPPSPPPEKLLITLPYHFCL